MTENRVEEAGTGLRPMKEPSPPANTTRFFHEIMRPAREDEIRALLAGLAPSVWRWRHPVATRESSRALIGSAPKIRSRVNLS